VILLPGTASANVEVAITGVTLSGGTGSVTGTAHFEAITAAQSVVGEESVNTAGAAGGSAAGDAAGLDLQDATIEPLANGSGLRFTWIMSAMPEQVPPEGVRYTWGFKVGTSLYQLQAKRTNIVGVSTTEDPVGTVQHHAANQNAFELRGACVAAYQGAPVNGCYHLAWLPGSFDTANKKVTMDMPFETKDAIGRLVAPNFKPGAAVVDNGGENTAGMAIAASFQAAVSNTASSQYINGHMPYYIGPQISLGVAAPNLAPEGVTYTSAGTLNGGTFNGTVTGLTSAKNTVYARACNGIECSYTSFKALYHQPSEVLKGPGVMSGPFTFW
jgi:hypothetical protein